MNNFNYTYDKVWFRLPDGQETAYKITENDISHYDNTDVINFNYKVRINLTNKLFRDFCNEYGYNPYQIITYFDNYTNATILFNINFNLLKEDNMDINEADGSFGKNNLLKTNMQSYQCSIDTIYLNDNDRLAEIIINQDLSHLLEINELDT